MLLHSRPAGQVTVIIIDYSLQGNGMCRVRSRGQGIGFKFQSRESDSSKHACMHEFGFITSRGHDMELNQPTQSAGTD